MPLPTIAEASDCKTDALLQPAEKVVNQLEGLRIELQQLHDSLERLDPRNINPLSAVLNCDQHMVGFM